MSTTSAPPIVPAARYGTRQASVEAGQSSPPKASTTDLPALDEPTRKSTFSPAGSKKSRWSVAEDAKLIELVKRDPALTWSEIAELIPGRKSSGCMMRWYNHVRKTVRDVERVEPGGGGSGSGLRHVLTVNDAENEGEEGGSPELTPVVEEAASAWTAEEDASLLSAVALLSQSHSSPKIGASSSPIHDLDGPTSTLDPALQDSPFTIPTASTSNVEEAAADNLKSLAKGKEAEKEDDEDGKLGDKAVDWEKVEGVMNGETGANNATAPSSGITSEVRASGIDVQVAPSAPAPFKTGSSSIAKPPAPAAPTSTAPTPISSLTLTPLVAFPKRTPTQYAARWTFLLSQSASAKQKAKKRTLDQLSSNVDMSNAEKDYRSQGRRKAVGLTQKDIRNAAIAASGSVVKRFKGSEKGKEKADENGEAMEDVEEDEDLQVISEAANAKAAQDLVTVAAAAAALRTSDDPSPIAGRSIPTNPRLSTPTTFSATPPIPFVSGSTIRGRRTADPEALAESHFSPSGKAMKVHLCPAEHCGGAFRRSEHLKRHYRSVHEGKKPCVCDEEGCGKTFSRKDNLLQHKRMVHHFDAPKIPTPSLRAKSVQSKYSIEEGELPQASTSKTTDQTAPQPPVIVSGTIPSVLQPVPASTADTNTPTTAAEEKALGEALATVTTTTRSGKGSNALAQVQVDPDLSSLDMILKGVQAAGKSGLSDIPVDPSMT